MYVQWFFVFKQKTAYEVRISDRSSDVCSSDLWPLVIAVVLVVLWLLFGRGGPVAVETAVARDAASSGPVSVLDATGYVVARRQATVSAKITGKVRSPASPMPTKPGTMTSPVEIGRAHV